MAENRERMSPPPMNESEAQRVSRALAEAAAEAEARNADEFEKKDGAQVADPVTGATTTAYGKFIVDGVLVDPVGRPIEKKG
jgi:hypothetical protein